MGKTSLSPLSVISGSETWLLFNVPSDRDDTRSKENKIHGVWKISITEAPQLFKNEERQNCDHAMHFNFFFFFTLIYKFFILIIRFLSTSIFKLVSQFSYTKRMENSGKKKKTLENKTYTLRNSKFCKTGKCRCLKLQ